MPNPPIDRIDRIDRIDLLGMSLAALSADELIQHIVAALDDRRGGWVVTANLDHLQRFVSEPDVKALVSKADLLVADGNPLLWAARLQGTPLPGRVAGSDLVWGLTERIAHAGHSLYLLGGALDAAELAAERFRARWPELRIAGVSSPFVSDPPSESEIEEIRSQLSAVQPDLVYVALGAPKQERVIEALRSHFPATWWMGVGISLSFVAGDVSRAPVWMQRTGIEWLHRMVQDPRRLARRYLAENLPFMPRLMWQAWRARSRH